MGGSNSTNPQVAARDIPLTEISADAGAQLRKDGTDPSTVAEYADALEAGAVFPPVVLYFDGTGYHVADGFHRFEAARRIGREVILAEVREGSQRDAVLAAASANATHGLRRTNADKRHAVETLLRDPQWAQWSDREIGKACRVDHKTVAKVRRELTGEIPGERAVTYTDRHGNTSEMRVGRSGNGASSSGRGSVFQKVLSGVADDALIAECERRGWEVRRDA